MQKIKQTDEEVPTWWYRDQKGVMIAFVGFLSPEACIIVWYWSGKREGVVSLQEAEKKILAFVREDNPNEIMTPRIGEMTYQELKNSSFM